MRQHRHQLDIGVEISEPHGFAVRFVIARQSMPKRPSHPALHVRDDRDTPLLMRRDNAAHRTDFSGAESGLFFGRVLDFANGASPRDLPVG
jgi:hypothetical protein